MSVVDAYDDAYVRPVEDGEAVAAVEPLLEQVDALVPDEFYDEQYDVRVSEPCGDTEDLDAAVTSGERLPLDGKTLLDGYAVKGLAGDIDVHGANMQVLPDGRTYPHDFELAGRKGLDEVYGTVRSMLNYESIGLSFTVASIRAAGVDGELSPSRLRDRIDAVADEIDTDELRSSYREDDRVTFRGTDVEEYSPAERIVANVEMAQDGSYRPLFDALYDRVRDAVDL